MQFKPKRLRRAKGPLRPRPEALETRTLLSGFAASWLGQLGVDRVGLGPDVGPDGLVDAEIALSGLPTGKTVTSIEVTASYGAAWEYGLNPLALNNADLVTSTSDPTQATLFISPPTDVNISGQTLTLQVLYSDNSTDYSTVTAGAVNPDLKVVAVPTVPVTLNAIQVSWEGQDGLNLAGSGSVHLEVTGIPAGRTVVAGMLNDPTSLSWAFGSTGGVPLTTIDPEAQPLVFQPGSDPTTADIGFGPNRDETGSSMTLRLILDDGSSVVATFTGGAADLGLRERAVDSTTYDAVPGDNLYTIANDYGTVHLAAGTYNLDSTLTLNNPVTIIGDPGAILLFTQPADSPDWTAAIKIHASNTTLEGFAVRFSGTINWAPNISYGPAVIGATDNYDVGFTDPLYNLTFKQLDLQSPPASSSWEEAVRLFRLNNTQNGVIEDNTLNGGMIEFFSGPWTITGNSYVGTVPDTFSFGVIAGHYTHDVLISNNTINGASPDSKTWRFVVLTQAGIDDTVSDNTVTGIGPRDDDTVPDNNTPETIVTEAYQLHYEGAPSSISAGGMVVQIPYLQGNFARTGDVVSVLVGPDAGQWRLISQALNSTSFLLDGPLSPADSVISISTGFVNLNISGNSIDSRGSSTAFDIVLAGNLFGTTVEDNQIIGGKQGIWIDGSPTNFPNIWGWSHAPVLGLVVKDNVVIDSMDSGVIYVEHSVYIKTNSGRVYFSGAITGNLIIWTQDFLDAEAAAGLTPVGFSIGIPPSIDPGELQLTLFDNSYQVPAGQSLLPSFEINSATINGDAEVDQSVPLTASSNPVAGLSLVDDTGTSPTDGLTSDGRLTFDADSTGFDYEYSLTGTAGTFLPISFLSGTMFLPSGLVQGPNTVYVEAVDSFGIIAGEASFSFTYDSIGPAAPGGLALVDDTGSSPSDGVTNDAELSFLPVANAVAYEFSLSGSAGTYLPVVLGSGTTFLPSGLAQGTNTIYLRAVDASGNLGPATSLTFSLDTTPPGMPSGLQLVDDSGSSATDGLTNDGRVTFAPVSDAASYEYSLSVNGGTYAPVVLGPGMIFLPSGLAQGSNTVYVRAVDAAGNRGAPTSLTFTYDTIPPAAVQAITVKANGEVKFSPVEAGATYEYRIGTSGAYQQIGSATSFETISLRKKATAGFIRAVDSAGNIGPVREFLVPAMNLRTALRLMRAALLKARLARAHR